MMIIFAALLLIPILLVGTLNYNQSSKSLNELGKDGIKEKMEIAISTIALLQKEVEAGNITLETAQEQAKEELVGTLKKDGTRDLNSQYLFGSDGYLTVFTSEGEVLGHPSVEGENLYESADENGFYFVKDFIEKAQMDGDYTEYMWEGEKKIAYSTKFNEWDWFISGNAYYKDFNAPAKKLLLSMIVAIVAIGIVGLTFVYFYVSGIATPIIKVRNHMLELSDGDLSIDDLHINRQDEIGDLGNSFNTMLNNLREIVSNIQSNSETVAATSEELSASSEQSSAASQQVAASIQAISEDTIDTLAGANEAKDIVQNMNQRLDLITTNVQDLSQAATNSEQNANAGFNVLNKAKDQMHHIQSSSHEMSSVILSLGETSNEIGNIIALIEDISNQTNLLALNAAIEAARAGEHGLGFAVVANEVRGLSEQSNQATDQVSKLIKDIQTKVNQTITAVKEEQKEIIEGRNLVDSASQSFTLINDDIEDVANKVQSINALIVEINSNSEELVETVQQSETIAGTTADNSTTVAAAAEEQSASIEEITSASESLASMAQELQELVGQFRTN